MGYGIIDTGTSLMYLPPSVWNNFKAAIEEYVSLDLTCDTYCYSKTSPCSNFYGIAEMLINIGQVRMTIPPTGYLLENALGYSCLIAVASSGSETAPYIFGDTFIRNYYTTFDYKKKTVSFAVSANAPVGV